MASEKQIAANRRNSLLSTGPKSEEGRAAVSTNAVRHGLRAETLLLPGESRDEFDQFATSMIDYLAPEGPFEESVAERIIAGSWRLRRTLNIERFVFARLGTTSEAEGPKFWGAAFAFFHDKPGHSSLIQRFTRYESHLHSLLRRDVRDFQAMRSNRTSPAEIGSPDAKPIS